MGYLMSLSRLGERIRSEQDRWLGQREPWKRAQSSLKWQSPPPVRGGLPRQVIWALAAVPFALALGVLLRTSSSHPEVVTAKIADRPYESGAPIVAPATAPVPVEFSDGSSVVLAPNAHASVDALGVSSAEVTLAKGKAQVHVVHRRKTSWSINAGPYKVRVTGTRFAVQWNPEQEAFELAMSEGSVVVTGCDFGARGRRVLANETVRATCPKPAAEQAPAPVVAEAKPVVEPPKAEPRPVRRAEPRSARSERGDADKWLKLARAGEYKDAYRHLREIFDDELAARGGDELLLMADVARLSGHASRAEKAYRTVRARFARSPQAANAAFSLARLLFDQRQAYGEAARWFEVYLEEEPAGPFAREALGRRVEALHRAGDARAARTEAARYLRLYPTGPHATAVRGLL